MMSLDESVQARLRELAEEALKNTKAGRMAWRTMDDEDAFLYAGPSASLVVDFYPRDRRQYAFKLSNSRGTVVDGLVANPPSPDPWGDGSSIQEDSDFELLSSLHETARRSALNIDGLLDAALEDMRGSRSLTGKDVDELLNEEPPS